MLVYPHLEQSGEKVIWPSGLCASSAKEIISNSSPSPQVTRSVATESAMAGSSTDHLVQSGDPTLPMAYTKESKLTTTLSTLDDPDISFSELEDDPW